MNLTSGQPTVSGYIAYGWADTFAQMFGFKSIEPRPIVKAGDMGLARPATAAYLASGTYVAGPYSGMCLWDPRAHSGWLAS